MVKLNLLLLAAHVADAGHVAALNYSSHEASDHADLTVVPDPKKSWGIWEGWGVSLCWWANVFGERDDLADAVFTMNDAVTVGDMSLPGLGLNIARYNAGGSAWREVNGEYMVASPNIPKFKQLEGFWQDYTSQDPSSQSWNWTVDVRQRAMLQKANERGVKHLELFSNSPMWWMLTNHNPSGAKKGTDGNLQSWNRRNHSVYLASVAAYAKDNWGVSFASVDGFNEPATSYWSSTGTQEGCHVGASEQSSMVQELREELDARGLQDTIVSASDETAYDDATATWKSFGEDAKRAVGRVNVHGYQTGGRRDLLFDAVSQAQKPLWNSEYGDGDASGMDMAKNLHLDFKWLHHTAYSYWQIVDESDGWGMLKFDSSTNTLQYPNTKWWVFAQYTRHILPGMTILDGGGDDDTVLAHDAATNKLVVIGLNLNKQEQTIVYDFSRFGRVLGPVTRWVTVSDNERYEKKTDLSIPPDHPKLSVKFPARTIMTIEVENVELTSSMREEIV